MQSNEAESALFREHEVKSTTAYKSMISKPFNKPAIRKAYQMYNYELDL